MDCLKETVSQLLGVPIDYYFTVETEGFVALVDAVGGVDFDIPVHMSYDDPHQGLSIHFEPGLRHLDGQEALAVCRLRTNQDGTVAYPDYDIGRTRTQQAMLKTVAAKALSQPLKLSTYVDIFLEHCDTDLSAGNLLIDIRMDLEEDVSTATLPGDGEVTYGGVSYCYGLYEEEVLALVNDLLNPMWRKGPPMTWTFFPPGDNRWRLCWKTRGPERSLRAACCSLESTSCRCTGRRRWSAKGGVLGDDEMDAVEPGEEGRSTPGPGAGWT